MGETVKQALQQIRQHQAAIGDAPVFPSLVNPQEPCSRYLLDTWLRRAYDKANLTKLPGGLWHPIHRRWVTECKGYPTKDVAAAGGWRHEGTRLTSYQHSDDEEIVRQVVLHPTQRLVAR